MKEITKTEAAMWGSNIIGFGLHRYKYASGCEGDWPIAAFSARKHYINSLNDVHVPTLKTLIKKSVAYGRANE